MTTTPPGWYRDPVDPNSVRWWDGSQWTQRRPVPPTQPAAQAAGGPQVAVIAPQGRDSRRPSRLLVPLAVGVVALLVGGVGGYLVGAGGEDSAAVDPSASAVAVPESADADEPTVPSSADLAVGAVDDDVVLSMIRDSIPAMGPMTDDLIAEQANLICGALRGLPAGSTADFARGFASSSQLSQEQSYLFVGYSIAWKCPEVS